MSTTLLQRIKTNKFLGLVLIILIFIGGIGIRVQYFDQASKDISAFERAFDEFFLGINPYEWAVESFSNPDDPSNHGFAYLPGLLYVNAPLYKIGLATGVHYKYLWKIPVLLADIGVGILLLVVLKKEKLLVKVVALSMWFFNPYAYFRGGYTYFDPLPIFFMMLALYKMEKKPLYSGLFYAFSVSLKTFPFLILPVFIFKLLPNSIFTFKEGKKFYKTSFAKFVGGGLLIAVLVSVPFMGSYNDFITYINGAVLIHSDRFVQGRPFLYYISYFYKIELFRIIPFKTYILLASFFGWAVLTVLYLSKKVKDKYVMSLIPFLFFYIFTPVLNRTHLIWFIPIYVLATNELFRKKRYLFYMANIGFYVFYAWYLIQWEDGFHVWHP